MKSTVSRVLWGGLDKKNHSAVQKLTTVELILNRYNTFFYFAKKGKK